MQKNYIAPQTEVILLSSEEIMDSISVIRHSGGSGGGSNGFDDENAIA